MEDVEVIEEFLRIRPSGYGYGDGDGDGSGDGYGDGSGSGSGSGSGDGDGYGSGYGDGYGDGDGDGDGSGYGDGYGYGYVYGYGLKEFKGERIWYVDEVPTLIDQVRGNLAKGHIVNGDLTLVPCFIARVDNCWAHGKTGHEAVAEAEAKALECMPVKERIESFKAQFPSLDMKAKCAEFYKWHHILTGSCTMGRDGFIKSYGLEMDKEYTVKYFLEITSNAFGGQIIRQLKESYS